jgi:hemoglobin/transferrin/lactoferrin receptor protein
LFVALLLTVGASRASAQVIEVQDDAGQPVPAAVIRNTTGEVRMTDMDGRLELDSLIRQGDTLEVRSLGFSTKSVAMPEAQMETAILLVPDLVNLSEVVVSSVQPSRELKAAETVSRISSMAVARAVPSNAATLLWQTGQVHIQQSQQGGGSPVLRGFEANRILLVVDGVRMNNAIYRSGHLQNAMTVDPFMLASTVVHHGAGSVQYGSDALGGVIHYRSRSPRWEPGARARAQLAYSSVSRSPTFHADAEVTRGKWGVLTSVTHRAYGDLRMGSWRPHGAADWGRVPWRVTSEVTGTTITDVEEANPDTDVQPGTGYHQTDVQQKVRFGLRERHIELNIQHSTSSNVPRFDRLNDATASGGPKWAEWDYGPQNRSLVSLRYAGNWGYKGRLSLTAAWQQLEESRLKSRFGDQHREVQRERVGVRSLSLDMDKMMREWRVAFGAFWSMDDVGSEAWMERRADGLRLDEEVMTRYPNGGAEMGSAAAYASVSRRWSRWQLESAARYGRGWLEARFTPQAGLALPFDRVSYNRGALTGSTTLRWTPRPLLVAHAVVSTAFRNPNVDDVGKVRAKDGFAMLPADQLKPERLASAEIGGRYRSRNGRLTAHVAGFLTGLRDAIAPVDTTLLDAGGTLMTEIVVEGDTNLIQVNANIGRAVIQGTQWRLNYQLESGWRLQATANFTRGRDLLDGGPLAHIPPAFGRCSAQRNWEWLSAELHWMWSGRKAADVYGPGTTDNLAEALPDGNPGWWTLGADAEGRLTDRFTVAVGVHNILDRHYKVFASGISAPGRDLRFSVRWSPSS